MDPYIERPRLWPDSHGSLASEIRASLNQVLPPGYVARIDTYVTYEVIELDPPGARRSIRPDAAVYEETPRTGERGSVATLIPMAPVESSVPMEVPLRLSRVEIHELEEDRLVTVIEILSPVNKRAGHDTREEYLRKRRELMRSSAHVMEIDLLRGGERSPLREPVPLAPYYVTLGRRNHRPRIGVWPIQLRDRLPVLPIPLVSPDPDVPLDLGAMVTVVYDRGRYGTQLDYSQPPPPPPLAEEEQTWIDELLRERRGGAAPSPEV
jgi:hypothetical protein